MSEQSDEFGTVKFFKPELGYGFILPDHGDRDIYLHRKQIANGAMMERGCRVKYELKKDVARGSLWAKNVRLAV
ncbi:MULTISPECIES: cold-shock protein [unclassified Bradyrhizobium]|uniref:cold-shock protein n=1 Tax=Bradyrhizobium sp. USDA 4541 TaxID=2817704 RepID=UPI0020A30B3D|nr:cold shock domain-containing protein [Bradyrhizobium sp. USDA 4541]MCP1852105.1 CspA family cold shock protein [Bradyrhizobium sp. USDA 4541]